MLPQRRNPAPRAAGRASKTFCLAAERSEDTPSRLYFQVRFLRRRGLTPARAMLIACLCFKEARL
jgi:hypothetical protein